MATKANKAAVVAQDTHARNVVNNNIVRMMQRIAEVQALRASKHAARIAARNHKAYIAKMHEVAAQLGVDPTAYLRSISVVARANSATAAPSRDAVVIKGVPYSPCKAVHELCATIPDAARQEQVQLCVDNGINKATAATQVGKFRAARKAELEAAETATE